MHTLRELLYSISATNVVDIGIITCLMYFILVWLRGTRAFQILATLLGMGLFYYAASAMGLILTSVLFQYLGAALILFLVVVFQPEIREMLDRASPIRYLSGAQGNQVAPDVVDETVKAVADLARLRVGALMVFQRLDRLDNLVLKGRMLDSLVSAEALYMIFHKNSPMHDGAVLIQQDRIMAAGCILPLSRDEALGSQYGTRHRAAVGLTERSDALCVVVSEERGEVSLVNHKEITIFRKKSEFRDALERGLVHARSAQQAREPGFLALLRANWRLKIFAFAIAVLLWFVIVGPQRSELGLSVPIQYTNLPPAMEITGTWMDRTDVRIRGSEAGLANLKPGSVRAVVDLGGVVTGLNFLRITKKDILVPPGITIAQIRPSDLQLHIQTSLMKKVNVAPALVGVLPEKTRVVVAPAEVTVRAIQDELKKLTAVTTEPVNVSDLRAKGKMTLPAVVKPDGLKIDSIDPMQVTVSLEPEEP